MPDVGERRAPSLRKQHGAFERLSVASEAWRSVGLLDEAMAGEPGRVLAAARERPRAAHPIAAIDRDRGPEVGTRRHDRARVAENVACDLGLQVGGRDHGPGCLADAPGGAGVRLGDLLDRLHERRRLEPRRRRTSAAAACGTAALRAARTGPLRGSRAPARCGRRRAAITGATARAPARSSRLAAV